MSRRVHYHLLARRETRPHEFDKYEPGKTSYWADAEFVASLCGEEYRVGGYGAGLVIEKLDRVTCPTCLRKSARAKLKARAPDAPKLSIEQDKELRGGFRYNQGWKALVDGEWVAVLGYQEHAWRIYPLTAEKSDGGELIVKNTYGVLGKEGYVLSRGLYSYLGSDALDFGTKEDALLACEGLRASGRLKTSAELIQEYHARVRRNILAADRLRRERSEAEQLRLDTIEALNEILEKETLSNFQRQGLMTAIARFERRGGEDA